MGTYEDERRELERKACQHYPHLLPPNGPNRSSVKEECPDGGKHCFRYIGWSETIGHYYRCTKCGIRD